MEDFSFSSREEICADVELEVSAEQSGGQPAEQLQRRRVTRGTLPARLNDSGMGMIALITDESTTYKEAIACAEKKKWMAAMTEGYRSLMYNQK